LSGPCAAAPGCAIAVGAIQTLTITFAIPADYAGPDPIVHTAAATDGAASDPKPANNSATSTTSLAAPSVDLTLTRTNGVTEVTPGLTTTYTITVTNAGPASAIGSRIVDVFDPSVFANVEWQCTASGTSSCAVSGTRTGDIDTLIDVDPGAGNAVVITAQALVSSAVPGIDNDPPGTVANSATVTAAGGISELDPADNSATETDAARTAANLSVVKTGPPAITPGTTFDYTITVANAGPSTTRDLVFLDVLEEGSTSLGGAFLPGLIQAVQAPAGSQCELQNVELPGTGQTGFLPLCTIPVLAPGASRLFTVTVAIPADFLASAGASHITNTAAVVSASVDQHPDFDSLRAAVTSTVEARADVVVTKTGPAAVVAGNVVSYFINIANDGPSAANVRAEDTLPPGLPIVDSSGACSTAFATGTACDLATLAPGEHATTRVDLLVPANYTGPSTISNTAVASTPGATEVNPADNTSTISTHVAPGRADVGVTLTGPASVPAGGTIEYTGRVTNFGPGPAFNVRSSDVIPAGATLVSGTIPPGPTTCTAPTPGETNLVSCLTEVLQVGETIEFRFTLQVDPGVVPGSILTNLAAASAETPDHNPTNKQVELITRVTDVTEAGLSIEQTDAPDPLVVGSTVTYRLTVRNVGPHPATAVTVTDTLPAEFTFVSAMPSQGTCAGVTCNLGTIAPGSTATVVVGAATSTPGVFTNRVTVTAAEPDPVLANNAADETTTIATADQADLLIEKIGPALKFPGDTGFYTITVTNRGPATASAVEVVDTMTAGLLFAGNSGACARAFPCEFESLQPGQSVVITTSVTVDPALPTPATVVNNATVTSTLTADPDPSNNTSAVNTLVDAASNANLTVIKVDSPDAVVAGTPLSYALSVLNSGPGAATDVVLTDVLPAGVTVISATPTRGTCTTTTPLTCSIGTMAAGAVVEIGILATAPSGSGGIVNTASVVSSAPDPDVSDNTTTENTNVLPGVSDLAITKVTTTPPIPGLAGTYQIVVRNNGPSAVAGAAVVDAIPGALTGVTWTCAADPGSACGAASGAGLLSTTVDLEESDSATFVLTGTIAPGAIGLLANTATVAVPADATDPNPANDVAVTSVPLAPSADLQVAVSGPAQATPGATINYNVTIRNAGPSDAASVTLADPAPAGLAFVAGGGACAAYPCALGTIAAGTTVVATATFAVPPGYTTPDPIVNTASASSAATPDPAAGNNTASATSAVAAPITDLAITKTNGVSTLVPGATTTYTIVVTNAGPSSAIGATVSDAFPAALTGVTWTCATPSGGSCSTPAGSGDINTGVSLPAGATAIFTATATAAPDAVGVLVNTASVAPGPGQSDPSSANNTDQDALTPQVDLAITKTGPPWVAPNNPLVYTITVTNTGPSNAENVVVTDPAPVGLQFVSSAGDCTTPFPCSLGTLTAGATRTITATFTLPSAVGVPLPITNIARVSTTTQDVNPANDSAEAATALNRDADIDVSTLVSPATDVLAGTAIVATVNVVNRGPNPATLVTVTDALPAGFEFQSAAASQGTYDAATGTWDIGALARTQRRSSSWR
jgi:uncharacterized repeat protein (TIGR01451 family)